MPDKKKKQRRDINFRTIYFRDRTNWRKVEALAEKEDRSVNYIIEKLVKEKL